MQLVYSSTCAVYGNPEKLPVTEGAVPKPINPYGEAKLMSEKVIRDYMHADASLSAVIFRYFNVYGSDPHALLGEWPRPELRMHSRISGACLDAAMHDIEALTITGVHCIQASHYLGGCSPEICDSSELIVSLIHLLLLLE
jgi:UDP-arabinose 4-epimerase